MRPETSRNRQRGFSLVLSLTVMASVLMLVITLASFLTLETRLVSQAQLRTRARQNALAALRRLSLNQALDAVPAFARHCRNAQLLTLFNVTERDGINGALRRYPYLLGRMEALDVFAQRLLALFGLRLGGALPRFNERPALAGVIPARFQPDFAAALARLETDNQAELAFFARLPPILATRPSPAQMAAGAS